MRFPFILRSQHDEVVGIYERVSTFKDSRIAELEALNKTLLNQTWIGQFGVELFPNAAGAQPAPEPPKTVAEKIEEEAQSMKAQEIARLASLRRTCPSKLAPAIARTMQNETARKAAAAHPARAVFAAAAESQVKP